MGLLERYPRLAGVVRPLAIIVPLLAGGPLALLLAFRLLPSDPSISTEPGILTWIAVGFAIMSLAAATLVPGIMRMTHVSHIADGTSRLSPPPPADTPSEERDAELLLRSLLACSIVKAALLEGAAFYCAIVYYLEGHQVCLILTVLLCLAVVLLTWPARGRVETWLQEGSEQIARIRRDTAM